MGKCPYLEPYSGEWSEWVCGLYRSNIEHVHCVAYPAILLLEGKIKRLHVVSHRYQKRERSDDNTYKDLEEKELMKGLRKSYAYSCMNGGEDWLLYQRQLIWRFGWTEVKLIPVLKQVEHEVQQKWSKSLNESIEREKQQCSS